MRRWASRLWDAYWDTQAWRDRDRVATVIAYAIFFAAVLPIAWVWPTGTLWDVTFWTMLFVLVGFCAWFGKRRARRQPVR